VALVLQWPLGRGARLRRRCHVLSCNELDEDHSAGEIQAVLNALNVGDIERVGELYQAVPADGPQARIRESLN
jgi:hypothetical protein